jgi:hypothetical protein
MVGTAIKVVVAVFEIRAGAREAALPARCGPDPLVLGELLAAMRE